MCASHIWFLWVVQKIWREQITKQQTPVIHDVSESALFLEPLLSTLIGRNVVIIVFRYLRSVMDTL